MPGPDATHIPLATPIDLLLTPAPLAHGRRDPTIRFADDVIWRATRTPEGAATLRLRSVDGGVAAEAWGPGAGGALEHAAELIGAGDEPSELGPPHRLGGDPVGGVPGPRMP